VAWEAGKGAFVSLHKSWEADAMAKNEACFSVLSLLISATLIFSGCTQISTVMTAEVSPDLLGWSYSAKTPAALSDDPDERLKAYQKRGLYVEGEAPLETVTINNQNRVRVYHASFGEDAGILFQDINDSNEHVCSVLIYGEGSKEEFALYIEQSDEEKKQKIKEYFLKLGMDIGLIASDT
jgi:hypothetical protein